MILERVRVDDAVWALRPDFAVLVIAVTGLRNGPGDSGSAALLAAAEAEARMSPDAPPAHVVAWQDAYRAFGARPQRTSSSVEALWKRARGGGLPRLNWLVDVYNAISVRHLLPVGGEDLDRFVGPIRLVRATGHEAFETTRDGLPANEPPLAGEVAWCDDHGVTCRRWNWRQGTRTRLTESTTRALFLLERLAPMTLEALDTAGDALLDAIRARHPEVEVERARLGPAAADTTASATP